MVTKRGVAKVAAGIGIAVLGYKLLTGTKPKKAVEETLKAPVEIAKETINTSEKIIKDAGSAIKKTGEDLLKMAADTPEELMKLLKGKQEKGSVEAKAKMKAMRVIGAKKGVKRGEGKKARSKKSLKLDRAKVSNESWEQAYQKKKKMRADAKKEIEGVLD